MQRSLPGTRKAELDTPALCLDLDVVEGNIRAMADYCSAGAVRLRPHTKTHKSPVLAHMQMAAGAIGITCAKLSEAEVMAEAGLKDILIANQIVGAGKITRLVHLATYSDVMITVDDAANVADLNCAARDTGVTLRVLVEVNIGMNRCGVAPGQAVLDLARQIQAAPGLRFEGLMGYEGHTVFIPDPAQRRREAEASLCLLVDSAERVRSAGIPVSIVSSGGTGTYDITGRYPGITELQAGSYITMDAQYREKVGVNFAYGLTVLSTVVSAPTPDRAECDAGLKAMTRDFGLPKVIDPPGWELTGLAEEHGHLRRLDGPRLRPGDKVEIVPNHGCTTVNLHDEYWVIRNRILAAIWPIAGRGKVY
jgi:D-serine deaminase-like pyridoxal phosphate-dependent protein